MKSTIKYFFVISFILIYHSSAGLAEEIDESSEKKEWSIVPVPILGYRNETNLILGVGCFVFHNEDAQNKDQKSDEVKFQFFYTLNDQYTLMSSLGKYFSGNRFYAGISSGYSKFPTYYYGIGPDSKKKDGEKYTPVLIPFSMTFLVEVFGKLYIGPVYEFKRTEITDMKEGGVLDSGKITGTGKNKISGTGIEFKYNNRNSDTYPTKGQYLDIKIIKYDRKISSDFSFSKITADYRSYFTIKKAHCLCFNIAYKSANGNVPFTYFPSLGNQFLLRGFATGRYIDNKVTAVQTEYRYPIFWRFGGTLFAGAGEVANDNFSFGKNIKTAGGIGLRFTVNTERTINLRIDMGYNSDGETALYFDVMEAF